MTLMDTITSDLKTAMKENDKFSLSVYRMLKSALQLEQINAKKELTDHEIISVIKKQVKVRKDSVLEYQKYEREDLVNNLNTKDIITLMKDAKIIYDKENIYKILEYMMICVYGKRNGNVGYINCIEIINQCMQRLKRNCNFDMTVDSMLFQMYECVKKGI